MSNYDDDHDEADIGRATKAPFPWHGGKSQAAPAVWDALGDVVHYVEPFAGSLAVLLKRPHLANRTYYSETVNDLDGLLINVWRAIQQSPDETARHCSWPVSELDLTARHVALVRWREECNRALLAGDPAWHDPKMAGWWLWGCACWIGGSWCAGNGPWTADESGRLVKQEKGRGRAAGVKSQRPELVNNGQGVNHAGLREPGVSSKRPHLNNNGRGVNAPQLREPGVSSQRPQLADDGRGVNAPQLRQPGVSSKRPHLGNNGEGVNAPQLREPDIEDEGEPHPVTMPRLLKWFRLLAARLRHVRIISGDWKRLLTGGASKTLPVRQGKGVCGVFLDPPYADTAGRSSNLYAVDSFDVAHDVRAWCLEHGDDQDYRIVLAGFEGEHGTALIDAGWREVEWFVEGWLRGGMGQTSKNGTHQQHRERLWLSPHCLRPAEVPTQGSLFHD